MGNRSIPLTPGDSRRVLAAALAALGFAGATLGQSPLWDMPGSKTQQYLGQQADNAGDVDADGVDDVIVSGVERVLVSSGATGQPIYDIDFSYFVIPPVSGAGDVDLDGHGDFIWGEPYASGPGGTTGAARVVSGATGETLYTMYGDSIQDEFGWDVNDCGDVNGDGWPDLVIGATGDLAVAGASGSAIVCSGKDGSLLRTCYASDKSAELGLSNGFGAIVDGIGDQDLDGFPDILAGPAGSPYIGYSFSGQTGQVLSTYMPVVGPDYTGMTDLAGIGDISGDGISEVALGCPGTTNKLGFVGSLDVFEGGTALLYHQVLGTFYLENFGHRIAGRLDQDGDGVPDVVVTSFTCQGLGTCGTVPGSASVLSGADWSVIAKVSGLSSGDEFGSSAVNLGDINGDGLGEFAVGSRKASYYVGLWAGMARAFSSIDLPFTVDDPALPLGPGGVQLQRLKAGPANAGELYLVLGSVSGLAPGVDLGPLHLPLNVDAYTSYALTPGASPLAGFVGFLGVDGKANCTFSFPPGLPPSFLGLSFQHAFVLLDSLSGEVTFASNSVPLTLTP